MIRAPASILCILAVVAIGCWSTATPVNEDVSAPTDVFWRAGVVGEWNTSTNWVENRAPCVDERATLPASNVNYTVTLNGNVTARGFLLGYGSILRFTQGSGIIMRINATQDCTRIQNATAHVLAPTVVEVDWDDVPQALFYNVNINNTATGALVSSSSSNMSTAMFTQLQPGTNYSIRIYAYRMVEPTLLVEEINVQTAVPVTWIANKSGNWSEGSSWDGRHVPCADEHINLPSLSSQNYSVEVRENRTVRSIMLSGRGAMLKLMPGTSIRLVSQVVAEVICPRPQNLVVEFLTASLAQIVWTSFQGATYSVYNGSRQGTLLANNIANGSFYVAISTPNSPYAFTVVPTLDNVEGPSETVSGISPVPFNFINTLGGQWSNGYNWDPLRVPCSSDHAQIPTLNSLSAPITNATTSINITGPVVLIDRNVSVRSVTLKRNSFIRLSGGGVFLKLSSSASSAAVTEYCDKTLLTPLPTNYSVIYISVVNGSFVLSSPNVTIITPGGQQVNNGTAVVGGSPVLVPGVPYKFVVNTTAPNTNFTIISSSTGNSSIIVPISMVANNTATFTPSPSTPTDLTLSTTGSSAVNKTITAASSPTVGRAVVRLVNSLFSAYNSSRDAFTAAFRRGVVRSMNQVFSSAGLGNVILEEHVSINAVTSGSVIVDYSVSTSSSPLVTCALLNSLNSTSSFSGSLNAESSTFFPSGGVVNVSQLPTCVGCDCSALTAALASTTITGATSVTTTSSTTTTTTTLAGQTTVTTTSTTTAATTPATTATTPIVVIPTTTSGGGLVNGPEQTSGSSGGGGGSMIPVAAGAGAGVLILVIVLVVVCRRKGAGAEHGQRGGKKKNDLFGEMQMNPLQAGPLGWDINKNNLTMGESLGMGYYGRVRKATLPDARSRGARHNDVVVWTLNRDANPREKQAFLSEISLMQKIGHANEHNMNVLVLLGCDSRRDFFIVVDHMDLGNLRDYLRDSRETRTMAQTVSMSDLFSFAQQTSQGMRFLANIGIVHRNLNASNVLVNSDMLCKVSAIGRDPYLRPNRLPVRWMAPECLSSRAFSTQSDAWALGIVIWEVFTLGATPYSDCQLSEIPSRVSSGVRLPKAPYTSDALFKLMQACWDAVPSRRPAFDFITQNINNLRATAGNFPPGGSREYMPILPEDMAVDLHRSASIGWDEGTYETAAKGDRNAGWDSSVYATGGADKGGSSPKKTATLQNPWDRGIYETGVDQAAAGGGGGWNASVYETGDKRNTLYDSAKPKTVTLRREDEPGPNEYSAIQYNPRNTTYERPTGERFVSGPASSDSVFVVPTEDDA